MSRVVFLDAGPLGLLSNPKPSPVALACTQWLHSHVAGGTRVVVPEIADYEVRRELLRANKKAGTARLNAISRLAEYQPITTAAITSSSMPVPRIVTPEDSRAAFSAPDRPASRPDST